MRWAKDGEGAPPTRMGRSCGHRVRLDFTGTSQRAHVLGIISINATKQNIYRATYGADPSLSLGGANENSEFFSREMAVCSRFQTAFKLSYFPTSLNPHIFLYLHFFQVIEAKQFSQPIPGQEKRPLLSGLLRTSASIIADLLYRTGEIELHSSQPSGYNPGLGFYGRGAL